MRYTAFLLSLVLALALGQTPVTALEFVPSVRFLERTVVYESETCDKAAQFYPTGYRSGRYRPLEWRCYASPLDVIDRATQQGYIADQMRLAGYELVEERPAGGALLQLWRGPQVIGLVMIGGRAFSVIAIRLEAIR